MTEPCLVHRSASAAMPRIYQGLACARLHRKLDEDSVLLRPPRGKLLNVWKVLGHEPLALYRNPASVDQLLVVAVLHASIERLRNGPGSRGGGEALRLGRCYVNRISRGAVLGI